MHKRTIAVTFITLSSLSLASCRSIKPDQQAATHSESLARYRASSEAKESNQRRSIASSKEASIKQQSESIVAASESIEQAKQQSNQSTSAKKALTADQQTSVNQAFLAWAAERATIGNMAVSDWYFDHGAAGFGDWFANSPDGRILVQPGTASPGFNAYPVHAIGGCVFYTALDGTVGKDNLDRGSFADNYSLNMAMDKPVSKYLLGDNGVVYELKLGNGHLTSTNYGFSELKDDGKQAYSEPLVFAVSEDTAAQAELKSLLANY